MTEHLKVIQSDFENVKSEKIGEVIRKHQEILEFFEDFNELYGSIIAQKFIATGIMFCALGYQIVEVSSIRF